MKRYVAYLAAALAAAACTGAEPPRGDADPAEAVLVLRGRVLDGTLAPPIENGAVVVRGDRIECVGRARACRAPRGAEVIDVEAGTILPGLIDLHVHARPHYLSWFLAAGVTTVRDANNALDMIETLLAVGARPRILWSGPMLDGPRTVMRFFGDEGVLGPEAPDVASAWTLEVGTPAKAVAAVDTLAGRGAAWVKLYEQLPPDVYRAAAAHARTRGLGVMTDLGMHGTRGLSGAEVDALQAMDAGAGTIEHASGYALAYQRMGGDPWATPLDPARLDSLAAATVRAGAVLVPTLSVSYGFSDSAAVVDGLPNADRLPREMREYFEGTAARRNERLDEGRRLGYLFAAELTARVHALGGTVGAGSDAPAGVYNIPGAGLHRELELLMRAGLSPLESIHAATGAAAAVLGRDDIGVLRAGAIADILVVDGDPVRDIRATRGIRAVIQGGRVLDLEALRPDPEA